MLEPEVQDRLGCQHHWLIDSPNGPVSRGICRACGEEREFQNYVEAAPFGHLYLERVAGISGLSSEMDAIRRFAEGSKNEESNEEA